VSLLSPALQRWAGQRLVPKILVANQTRRIEAVIDRTGAWLPSVPVITCTTERLDDVAAVLHSDAATEWVRYHAAGSGLSATSVRPQRLLASIPCLQPWPRHCRQLTTAHRHPRQAPTTGRGRLRQNNVARASGAYRAG
jgi:hypothetical protein